MYNVISKNKWKTDRNPRMLFTSENLYEKYGKSILIDIINVKLKCKQKLPSNNTQCGEYIANYNIDNKNKLK